MPGLTLLSTATAAHVRTKAPARGGDRSEPSGCCSYTVLPNTVVRLFRMGRFMATDRSA